MTSNSSRRRAGRAVAGARSAAPASTPTASSLPPITDETRATRGLLALVALLTLLVIARAALGFVPSMAGWGLNLQRFILPAWAWIAAVVSALVLLPSVARALVPPAARAGNTLVSRSALPGVVVFAIGAALVLCFPDRVRYVGDFLLRQGTVEESARAGTLFPQALPLDVFLHVTLPGAIAAFTPLDANGAARLIGAIEAGLLAVLARRFATALELRDVPALAAAVLVFFGGWLGLYTGYSKAFGEMVLLVALFGVAGVSVIRTGHGLLALGVGFAIALLLHRSALGLLPALAGIWAMSRHTALANGGWRRGSTGLALAIPLLALAVMLPRLIATMRQWDVVHVASPDVQAAGGLLAAMFAGTRGLDLANLLVALTPFALAIPILLAALSLRLVRGRELAWLALLAAPFAASLLIVHPAQGLFRDWDDFAAAGIALALIAAWLVGESLRAAPRLAWVGVAAAVTAAVHGKLWVIHHADLDRGLARMEAFMREPPERGATERATTLDFIGIRNYRAGRFDAAADAWRRAADVAPGPRILREWGTAELRRGNLAEAQRVFARMVERNPDDPIAWSEYGTTSARLGDRDATLRAADAIERIRPGDPAAETLRRAAGAITSRD